MSFFQFVKSKQFFIQILIAAVGLVIFIFLLKFWLGSTTNHSQKIQVPSLEKMSLEDVKQKLDELDLSFSVIDSASYNPDFPPRSVIEQDPEAGDFVKEQRKIYLTLNPTKYRDVSIPDVIGRTKRQATTQLRAAGFIIGTNFTYVNDIGKDVARGLRHNNKIILPQEKLPQNSIIELVLGDGNGN